MGPARPCSALRGALGARPSWAHGVRSSRKPEEEKLGVRWVTRGAFGLLRPTQVAPEATPALRAGRRLGGPGAPPSAPRTPKHRA
eukprot:2439490-Pyramimonas_sp.AAC.2